MILARLGRIGALRVLYMVSNTTGLVVAFDTMQTDQDGPRIPAALIAMARRDLQRWAKVYAQRDAQVRLAHESGIGVNEITRTTGLAKTTVLRILRADGQP
jgi:DNA invertase Pin-like site-specific DNA recombinase